jgi:hypothetical protein
MFSLLHMLCGSCRTFTRRGHTDDRRWMWIFLPGSEGCSVLEFAARKMIQVRLVQVGSYSLSDISLYTLEIEPSSLPDGVIQLCVVIFIEIFSA